MRTKPFFSIVIPTLNEEKYIPRLLKSLEKQKYRNFEVIIVDGSSKDKTVAVIKQFENRLPKLIVLVVNKRNVSYQRNEGAKIAEGEYLIFWDADVLIPRNYLIKLHNNLVNNNVSIATSWLVPDSSHPADEALIMLINLIMETSRFIDLPFAPGFNLFFKRNVFFKIGGFPEKVIHAEDHEIVKQAHAKGYFLTVFKEPKLTASLRRLRKEGRMASIRKFAQATLYVLFKGPITKAIFDYPMGGHYHQNVDKKKKQKLANILKKLSENGEKTATRMFKDIFELQ